MYILQRRASERNKYHRAESNLILEMVACSVNPVVIPRNRDSLARNSDHHVVHRQRFVNVVKPQYLWPHRLILNALDGEKFLL